MRVKSPPKPKPDPTKGPKRGVHFKLPCSLIARVGAKVGADGVGSIAEAVRALLEAWVSGEIETPKGMRGVRKGESKWKGRKFGMMRYRELERDEFVKMVVGEQEKGKGKGKPEPKSDNGGTDDD